MSDTIPYKSLQILSVTPTQPGGVLIQENFIAIADNLELLNFNNMSGTAVPSAAPNNVGQIFIDTVGRQAYIAVGLTSGDWKQITI